MQSANSVPCYAMTVRACPVSRKYRLMRMAARILQAQVFVSARAPIYSCSLSNLPLVFVHQVSLLLHQIRLSSPNI